MSKTGSRRPSSRSRGPRVRFDRATWNDELEFAAAKAEEQPAEFPEAQQEIMQLIETDLTHGPEAACAAAIERCAELGVRPTTRHAIAVFFQRRRRPS